ncbi:hypothetical protein [Bifidobacterium mongoliense]|uniref:hypothetical protein n=1 Tax=Bifidobacterium mongoliense TaxID=518643 RepID=UPI00264918B6|nr:hypothetical protein [Bifidobacterium mongoliense]MDN6024651.1 hypothetical protein [Bifidobacterium mongoliense]MDN6720204.1 hypothetical protein [Bifidobacterium mongoliense]
MAATQDDKTIGHNLQVLRGDMSQDDLAKKMRAYGFKWSKATVWSVEQGERPLRLTEASAVLECLGKTSMWAFEGLMSVSSFAYVEKLRDSIQKNIDTVFNTLDKIWKDRINLAGNADSVAASEEGLSVGFYSAIAYELRQSLTENIFKQYLVHRLYEGDKEQFERDFVDKYDYETMTQKLYDKIIEQSMKDVPDKDKLTAAGGEFMRAMFSDEKLKQVEDRADTHIKQAIEKRHAKRG